MKIPIDIDTKFEIGDRIKLVQQLNYNYVLYLIGHEFNIIKKDNWGFVLQDDDGDVLYKAFHKSYFTKIISLKDAKRKYTSDQEFKYIINQIDRNCDYKDYRYEDRDEIDTCILKIRKDHDRTSKDCEPCLNCLQYQNSTVLQDEKVKLYLRKLKLDNLK